MKKDNTKIIEQIKIFFKNNNLNNITPIVLSDSGNLNIRISPHPIFVRISTFLSKQDIDLAFKNAQKEIDIANHLYKNNIPVTRPANMIIGPGPYLLDGLCMTIWEYARVIKNKDITPKEAEKSLIKLSNAINTYELQLDRLGLWKRVTSSAHRLRYRNEEQIKELLKEFDYINEELSTLSDKYLVPTHGDAHHGNHLYTDKGWLWTDFEDACIMPKYWDFVSYVSNRVLFNGSNEPIYQYIINNTMEINDIDFFHFMLRARMVFATLSNIDNVLLGYGDSGDEWFAKRQLELTIDYLDEQ